MGGPLPVLRRLVLVAGFLAKVYLAYLCTYLGPTAGLRRWGATTSWLLSLTGDGLISENVNLRTRGTNILE